MTDATLFDVAEPEKKPRRKPSTSPTQRSLKLLKANGYRTCIVEKFNSFIKIRQDAYGCIDIIAIKRGVSGVLGVQVTSSSNIASHRKKIEDNQDARLWVECGNRLELHGWSKRGPRGQVKKWGVTVQSMFEPAKGEDAW